MRRAALVVVLAACATAAPRTAPSPSERKDLKPWAEATKDATVHEGLWRVHVRRDQTILLELPASDLDRDLGVVLHLRRGLGGEFRMLDGLALTSTTLVRFHRAGNAVLVMRPNPAYLGLPAERSIGVSVLAALKIESERPGGVLVDLTPFLVSDHADVLRTLKDYYPEGKGGLSFDKARSLVERVMAFPRNMELDVLLTYQASDPLSDEFVGASDYRSLPVAVRYSFFTLPDKPMTPRRTDDRVGFFADGYYDFSRPPREEPRIAYINRWRLQRDKPLVFFIDRSVPPEYRRYVKEGIEAWNRAFASAGFPGAVVARDAPDDPSWSAEDIRYSAVRWSAGHRSTFGGIGMSSTDPRSGEILKSDVLLWSEVVRGFDREIRAYGGSSDALLGDAVRWLTMHEVGHTLGLRHNFRASASVPYEKLHDKGYTREHGIAGSVMDYPASNFSADPASQGDVYDVGVGHYDIWAIRYGYADVGPAELAAIAAEPPAARFGTDEDARDAYAADPLTARFDLGSDPIRFAADRMVLIDRAIATMGEHGVAPGEPYDALRKLAIWLIPERVRVAKTALGFVGGVYFARTHKGAGAPPLTPVPGARQREALRLIVEKALGEGAVTVPPEVLALLVPYRGGSFGTPDRDLVQIDFPLHRVVRDAQDELLGALLHPARLARIIDNGARGGASDPLTLAELFETLTRGLFAEVEAKRGVGAIRRNLQRAYVERLIGMLLPAPPAGAPPATPLPDDARALARLELGRIAGLAATALRARPEAMTRAHLEELAARARAALEAKLAPPR